MSATLEGTPRLKSTGVAVKLDGVRKVYGRGARAVIALDGLDLYVDEGTLLAVLGPNGAGKTTAVRILSTLLKPDAGRATVAGFDVLEQSFEVKKRIPKEELAANMPLRHNLSTLPV